MRIVAIRGRDLASLKGDFAIELDQPPLSHLGLFSIHGPVGSGKSTLLDAMCLALFGRTPRLSGQGGAILSRGDDDVDQLRSNDPSTLVRRGAASAMAEVDFVGVDGRLYRSRWEVKRTRSVKGRVGKLKGEEHTLVRLPRHGSDEGELRLGDTKTEVLAAVADRLGLNFDELCRSVLLAQGGFQSFLLAKPNERAMLLEKVTGTEVYTRLGIAAYERGRRAGQRRGELVASRAACGVLDDDARAELHRTVVTSSSAEADAEGRARALERRRERRQARRAVDDAAAAVDTIDQVLATLTTTQSRVVAAVDDARALVTQATPLLQQARQAQARTAAAAHADDVARAAANAARARLQTSMMTAQQATARQLEATAQLATATTARQTIEQRVGARAVASAVARALQALVQQLTTVRGAGAVVATAAEIIAGAHAAVVAAEGRVDVALQTLRGHLRGSVVEGCDDVAVIAAGEHAVLVALVDADSAAAVEVEADLKTSRAVLERFSAALAHHTARDSLVDGDPCPVCGSAEHPFAAGQAPSPLTALVEQERATALALEARLREHRDRTASTRGRLSTATTLSTTTTAFTLPTTLPALLALAQTFAAARPAITRLASERAALAEATATVDNAVAAHAIQVAHKEAAEGAVTRARDAVENLGVSVDLDDDDALRERLRTLTSDLASLTRAIDDEQRGIAAVAGADRAVVQADADVVRADGERGAADVIALERHQQRCAVDDDASDALRAVHALPGADDGSSVDVLAARWQRTLTTAEAALAAHSSQLAAATTTRAGHCARLAERVERHDLLGGADADNDSDVGDDVIEGRARAARAEATAARDAAALARAGLVHDDLQRQRAVDIDTAIAAHDVDNRVWIELAELIGAADGARFRQFAQGLTLDALIAHANEHLATLAPRYRLRRTGSTQQKHDLDLVVVDTEAGDDIRSTATLSGGESFLVSLALALGLSSLSANEGARGRVESLFIDEGFSALDQETLDVALAAFDALRQTGRQIGVISHVPLLVERLGAQVRVIPIGGGASRVEVHAG